MRRARRVGGAVAARARTELQLAGVSARHVIRGRLERCHVAALEPLRYRGVIVFDESVELGVASIPS